MILLPDSKHYYLYLDESGDFEERDDNKNCSLIAGVLCTEEINATSLAEDVR